MAIQYASLAQALEKYGDEKAKKIPAAEGAECGKAEQDKIQDLYDRGYRFIDLEAGSFSADELEGVASKTYRLKPELSEWDDVKSRIPYQTKQKSVTNCADPKPEHIKDYGWAFKGNYFYSEKFEFFGGSFGKNVFFEGLSMNKRNASEKEIKIKLDSEMQQYNLGNGGDVIVGENGEPIVEFNGMDIVSYVDVEIIGNSDSAYIKGQGVSSSEISVDKNYNNNFEGSSCG
tara:strand:- start:25262 stop:25954 length:693 start_codon:yes stop_codon:yes gene_type:complete